MTIRIIFTAKNTWWSTAATGEAWRDTLEAAVESAYQLSGAVEGDLVIRQAIAK